MAEEIVNRVAKSPLVQIDLETWYHQGERVVYDLKDNLFQGMILREKDFREFVKTHDWQQYQNKNVVVTCSADAIVPTWAYMLLTSKLQPFAHMVAFGDEQALEQALFFKALNQLDVEQYRDKIVVVKGCGKFSVTTAAYVEITRRLQPVVKSIMYGEPCSTVPVYKKPKNRG